MTQDTQDIRKLLKPGNRRYSDYTPSEIDAIISHPQFDALMG
jgi:hypothetical protein